MKTVEQFDGSYGVTTDEQFGELVDFLNGKEVVKETEHGGNSLDSRHAGVYTEYRIEGETYLLFHQTFTPNTPAGTNCSYEFSKLTQ
jgi:hypothetical protein